MAYRDIFDFCSSIMLLFNQVFLQKEIDGAILLSCDNIVSA